MTRLDQRRLAKPHLEEGTASNRKAAMERTQATINAGVSSVRPTEGRLEQYNEMLLAETLERAGTMEKEFDAEGNPVTNWGIYDEMLTLTAKAERRATVASTGAAPRQHDRLVRQPAEIRRRRRRPP